MIVLLLFFVINNNFIIKNIDDGQITLLFNNFPFIALSFSILGLMFTINGFNFIDGNNGLLLGTTIIILFNFLIYSGNNNHEVDLLISSLLLVVIILFVFNFFSGSILTGDTGSYFLGFLIGTIAILLKNYGLINSYLIACIISYPIFELITSFFRRLLINKKNPFSPDSLHLHSMLFTILRGRFENILSINMINSFTSLVIICYQAFISLGIFYYSYIIGYFYSFFILLFLYLCFYLILYNKLKNSF